MKNKKVLALLTAAAITCANLSALPMTAMAEDEEIKVYVDGERLEFDVDPVTEDDRTLVPMRAIFEALGATVEWDDDTQTATAERGGDVVAVTIDSEMLYKNGRAVVLDVPARMIDDRTLVPVRAISESFDAEVEWIEETQSVIITTPVIEATVEPTEEPTTEPTAEPTAKPTAEPAADTSAKHTSEDSETLSIGELSDEDMEKLRAREDYLRFAFEQVYLPATIFQDAENDLLYSDLGDSTDFQILLTAAWSGQLTVEIMAIQSASDTKYNISADMTSDEMLAAYIDVIKESGLDPHISGSGIGEDDETGARIAIIMFEEADDNVECKFIGIIATEDGGARYYTAENDPIDPDHWYVGEIDEDLEYTVLCTIDKTDDEDEDFDTFTKCIIALYEQD